MFLAIIVCRKQRASLQCRLDIALELRARRSFVLTPAIAAGMRQLTTRSESARSERQGALPRLSLLLPRVARTTALTICEHSQAVLRRVKMKTLKKAAQLVGLRRVYSVPDRADVRLIIDDKSQQFGDCPFRRPAGRFQVLKRHRDFSARNGELPLDRIEFAFDRTSNRACLAPWHA